MELEAGGSGGSRILRIGLYSGSSGSWKRLCYFCKVRHYFPYTVARANMLLACKHIEAIVMNTSL